jgi:hypothetical protein
MVRTLVAALVAAAAVLAAPTAQAAAPALDVTGWADTAGTPVPGAYLTADPGTWADPQPAAISYQWLRDGAPIDGATLREYEVTSADVGHQLTPQVTGSRDGYAPDSFVGTPLAGRPITTSLTLDVRRAVPPGGTRKVWLAAAPLHLERPWTDEGTVSILKRRHGHEKVLAQAPVSRGLALAALPWKHAPRTRTKLVACFSGTTALAPSCSAVTLLKR